MTNLWDSGPGSLRAAIDARGPRIIVFDVGGTIHLETPLTIRQGRVTIAGQTAPGGGVTLADQPFVIAADDVVVRFIRARLGDRSGVEGDAVSVTRGRRIILDHLSATWSVDETLSVASRYDPPERGIYDVTVQWSLIADSLNASHHAKGEHGYGSLVRAGHGARISFVHNLWANHRARMPRPGNYDDATADPVGAFFEFRSNVFYNWGGGRSGYSADTDSRAAYAFVGNVYLAGPDSTGGRAFEDANPLARAWFEANTMNGRAPADPWSLVRHPEAPDYRMSARPDWAGGPGLPPAETEQAVLARVGASRVRDPVDAAIIQGVRARTGRIIDSMPSGGWPELAAGIPWVDADGDGLPDDWERAHGLDPVDPSDAAVDPDGDGYDHLDDWLNALAEEAGR